MKKPNITPGKWKYTDYVSDSDNNTCILTMGIDGYDGGINTDFYNSDGIPDEQLSANAKAISAVPEMIDALTAFLKFENSPSQYNYEKAMNLCKQALTEAGVEL